MANEFIARNGIIARNSTTVSGSLLVSGSVGIGLAVPRTTAEIVGTLRITNIDSSSRYNDLSTDLNGYMTLANLVYTGGIGSNSGRVNLYQDYIAVGVNSGYFLTSTDNAGGAARDVGISRVSASVLAINNGAAGNASGTLLATNLGLGLGISTPTARLQIKGSGTTSGTTALLVQNANATASLAVDDSGTVFIGSANSINGTLRVERSGGNTGLIIRGADGNLIGGGGWPVYEPYNYSNATHNWNLSHATLGSYNWYVGANSTLTSNTFLMRLTRSGSLLIGTLTESAKLNVSGASADTLLRIESPNSSSIFVVSGSGRVSIGSNNPAATFDVLNTTASLNSVPIAAFRTSGSTGHISLHNYTTPFEVVRIESSNDIGSGGSLRLYTLNSGNMTEKFRITNDGQTYIGTGGVIPTARLQVRGIGATSATNAFVVQNSTPTNLFTIQDNGQIIVSSATIALLNSQSAVIISQSIQQPAIVGSQVYGVSITPTFIQVTASQTETALRVVPTFTTSSAAATGGTNIIADFGANLIGSQLTVTDVISGSIYMVNDVSGLPIIEATSDWSVNMYNFPTKVFEKTGSQININGTLKVSGSFIFPLTSSVSPQTGSAYWSGSLLFIWDGTRYRSSSFA